MPTAHLGNGSKLLGPVPVTATSYPFGSFARKPSPVNLASYGYEEQEYFLSGTATSYKPAAQNALQADGQWAVVPYMTAPYTTRLLVERPDNPRAFNGTVVVEWTNVSAGADVPVDFDYMHQYLLSAGYAVVEVSAQYVGIEADKKFNPERYQSLSSPGDSYSYDIFTQAGQAVRAALHGLKVSTLLADGESQSASRMVTYIDAIQPLAKVYNGFLVHSRGAQGAPLWQSTLGTSLGPPTGTEIEVPTPSPIRTDLTVPVLQFETETDVVGSPVGLGFGPARQPDNALLRTWETAGTSHVDQYFFNTSTPILERDIPNGNFSFFDC
ncbi:MAG: alpha/beta hydrolase domain-containing protein, partial [Trebonia sp.]